MPDLLRDPMQTGNSTSMLFSHSGTTSEQLGCMQVYCVNWNVVRRNIFLTGSWDDTIKLWDLNSPTSLATFKEHTYCVYATTW